MHARVHELEETSRVGRRTSQSGERKYDDGGDDGGDDDGIVEDTFV